MTSSINVFQNGCHDGQPFGVPNDGLANPGLRRRKSKNRECRKVDNYKLNYFKTLSSDVVQILSTGGIEK